MVVLFAEDQEPAEAEVAASDLGGNLPPAQPPDGDEDGGGEPPGPTPAWALYRDPGPAAMFP